MRVCMGEHSCKVSVFLFSSVFQILDLERLGDCIYDINVRNSPPESLPYSFRKVALSPKHAI